METWCRLSAQPGYHPSHTPLSAGLGERDEKLISARTPYDGAREQQKSKTTILPAESNKEDRGRMYSVLRARCYIRTELYRVHSLPPPVAQGWREVKASSLSVP